MAGPIKKIGPFTQTKRALQGPGEIWDGLGYDWDKNPGAQYSGRLAKRAAMGQKMTPKGDVRLTKRK